MILVEEWKRYLEELMDPQTIDIANFEVQNSLNPDLWPTTEKINSEIGDRLYEIAKEYFKNLELDWVDIVDITVTGSLANYTWSRHSDIDLHILVDYEQIDENQDLVKDFLRKASSLWNRNHKILIKDFEVEIYVQDANEPHFSSGVYSIKNDEWIKVPSREDPDIDYENVQKKSAKLMDDVDEVSELFLNKEYDSALEQAETIQDKIRKFRQSGLERGGVFSNENLAFKVLRRNGYLRKLSSLRIMSYDRSMSINGN